MKKFVKGLFCFTILAIMIFGASYGMAGTPGVTADKILVGSTLDQSGPSAFATKQFVLGCKAFFHKINSSGGIHGRKIDIVFEDGRYNPAATVAAGKLLIERDQVFCLLMDSATAGTLALAPILAQEKVPQICPLGQSSAIGFSKPKRYTFPLLPPYEIQTAVLVDYAVKELAKGKSPKIAIMYQDDEYGYSGLRGFQKALKKYNLKPAVEVSFKRGNVDFSSQTLKLRSKKPEYIILHNMWREGSAVLKEARKMGWKPQFMGTSGMSSERVIKLAGKEAAAGLITVSLCVDINGNSEGAIEYRNALKSYDPKIPVGSVYRLWGYGATKVLVEGLKRTGKDLTREKFIDALETMKGYANGVTPPVTYGKNIRYGGDSVLLQKVVGEKNVIFGDWRK